MSPTQSPIHPCGMPALRALRQHRPAWRHSHGLTAHNSGSIRRGAVCAAMTAGQQLVPLPAPWQHDSLLDRPPAARLYGRIKHRTGSRAAQEVLRTVAQPASMALTEPYQPSAFLRFPTLEFRSLVLNPLGKRSFPDRGLWKRYKVELCSLLPLLSAGRVHAFHEALHELVARALAGAQPQRWRRQAPEASEPARSTAAAQAQGEATRAPAGFTNLAMHGASAAHAAQQQEPSHRPLPLLALPLTGAAKRHAAVSAQIERWCRTTVSSAAYATIGPILERVLDVGELAPLLDIRRSGTRTELAVASLLLRHMPAGWSLVSQARVTAVDGQAFANRKMLKGELDLLLVDPGGAVQALLEVKTAKGNPYLALYEDVSKLLGLLDAVRGRSVTVRCGPTERPITLAFPRKLKPIYVLGCGQGVLEGRTASPGGRRSTGHHHPSNSGGSGGCSGSSSSSSGSSGLAAGAGHGAAGALPAPLASAAAPSVVRSAQSKLLRMMLGRQLSSDAGMWASVSIEQLSREEVVLALPESLLPPLACQVDTYFAQLAKCDVFVVPT